MKIILMRLEIWSIILALMLNSCARTNTEEEISVPFTLTDNGHILIKAKINGIEGEFIFDTGAGMNVMTKKFADKVSDIEGTNSFYTGHRATGEALQVDLWKTNTLDLGSFTLPDQTFSVIDIDLPIDGLISLMPFKETPITIDYADKIIRIETKIEMEKMIEEGLIIPIQISDDRGKALSIYTYVKLNNQLKLQIALDCGAGFNVYRFNSRYMETLGIDTNQIISKFKKSDFKPTEGNKYYYTNLYELQTLNAKIRTDTIKATFIEGLIYEGITSMNWLGDEITIDIINQRLIVK